MIILGGEICCVVVIIIFFFENVSSGRSSFTKSSPQYLKLKTWVQKKMDQLVNVLRDTVLLYNTKATMSEWFEMMRKDTNKKLASEFLNNSKCTVLFFLTHEKKKGMSVYNEVQGIFANQRSENHSQSLIVYILKKRCLKFLSTTDINKYTVCGSLTLDNTEVGKTELLKHLKNLTLNFCLYAFNCHHAESSFLWEMPVVEKLGETFQQLHEITDKRIENLRERISLPLPSSLNVEQEESSKTLAVTCEDYVKKWWQTMNFVQNLNIGNFHHALAEPFALKLETIKLINQCDLRVKQMNLLMQQLESKNAVNILNFLKEVGSPFYDQHFHQMLSIVKTMKYCNDQLKFMRPLKQFFKTWERSASNKNIENVSAQLPWIFRSLSNIWQLSAYYSKASNMQSLIRLVLTDMVRVLSKCIDVSSVFKDDSLHEIKKLRLAISICFASRELFDKESRHLKNRKSSWDMLSEKHIFSITRKFRNRCQSLLYVVDVIQNFGELPRIDSIDAEKTPKNESNNFASPSRGTSDTEIMKIYKQFQYLKKIFLKGVHSWKLINIGNIEFENYFRVFKAGVARCEIDLGNVLSAKIENIRSQLRNLYQGKAAITESTASLDIEDAENTSKSKAFYIIKALDTIGRFDAFKSCAPVKFVCNIGFEHIMKDVKNEIMLISILFDKSKMQPHIPENVPHYAGCVMWALALRNRANELCEKVLGKCPEDMKQKDIVVCLRKDYSSFQRKIEDFVMKTHNAFTVWLNSTLNETSLEGSLLRRLGLFATMKERSNKSLLRLKESFISAFKDGKQLVNVKGATNSEDLLDINGVQKCIKKFGIDVSLEMLQNDWIPIYYNDASKNTFTWKDVCNLWSAAKFDVRIAFNKFDEDKSGYIDRKEFSDILRGMGVSFTATQFQQAVSQLDPNNDGIDFEEFYGWWSNFQDHSAPKLLEVNVEPHFVWLLKEVRYFQQMKMQIPPEAESLMTFESSFRRHKAQLELIVSLYNGMHVTLLPVERPLLYERMVSIESLIEKAVTSYCWESVAIGSQNSRNDRVLREFLSVTLVQVSECVTLLQELKTNIRNMENIVIKWARLPLVEHTFAETQALNIQAAVETLHNKISIIAADYRGLCDLFDDTRTALGSIIKRQKPRPPNGEARNSVKGGLRVTKGSTPRASRIRMPSSGDEDSPWKAYVRHWNSCLFRAIKTVVKEALVHILCRLGLNEEGEKLNSPENKLFELKLILFGQSNRAANDFYTRIAFYPPVVSIRKDSFENDEELKILHKIGMDLPTEEEEEIFQQLQKLTFLEQSRLLCSSFFKTASVFYKFETNPLESFYDEIGSDQELLQLKNIILKHLSNFSITASKFKCQAFDPFSFLWEIDPKECVIGFVSNKKNNEGSISLLMNEIIRYFPKFVAQKIAKLRAEAVEKHQKQMRKNISDYDNIKLYFERKPNLKSFQHFVECLQYGKELVKGIEPERIYHGVKIQTKHAQSVVVSSIDVWIQQTLQYLISFVMQRIDDIYAFCTFMSEQLGDFSDVWIPSKYDKDDLGFAFGYAACFKKNEIVYKTTISIVSDVIQLLRKFDADIPETWKLKMQNISLKWTDIASIVNLLQTSISKVQSAERELFFDKQKVFAGMIKRFKVKLDHEIPSEYYNDTNVPFSILDALMGQLLDLETGLNNLNIEENMFELELSEFNSLPLYKVTILGCQNMWDIISYCESHMENWMNQTLKHVNSTWENQVKNLASELKHKHLPLVSKDFKESNACLNTHEKIHKILECIQIIVALKGAPLRERHYKKISSSILMEIKLTSVNDPQITCGSLFKAKINDNRKKLYEVIEIARRQYSVERALKNISKTWMNTKVEFCNAGVSPILTNIVLEPRLFESIEDHRIVIQNILSGKNAQPFLHIIKKWKILLSNLSKMLACISKIQAMQKIIAGFFTDKTKVSDLQVCFRNVFVNANTINSDVQDFFEILRKSPNIHLLGSTLYDLWIERLNLYLLKLNRCYNDLGEAANTRRREYSRLYFVDTKSLVSLLSSSNVLLENQSVLHLMFSDVKCFLLKKKSNVNASLAADGTFDATILGIKSHIGEILYFLESLQWSESTKIGNLLQSMERKLRASVRNAIYKALFALNDKNGGVPYGVWIIKHLTQAILIATSIVFSRDVSAVYDSFSKDRLLNLKSSIDNEMDEISMLIRSELRAENRVKCIDLLQMKVNHRDVLKILSQLPVKGDRKNSTLPFEWDIRLKHNSTSNNSINVNIHHGDRLPTKNMCKDDQNFKHLTDVDASCFTYKSRYLYEFFSSGKMVVNAAWSERATVAITQAINNSGFSGQLCLTGPSGSGKVSLMTFVASMFGRPLPIIRASNSICLVANFIIGTISSGSWGIIRFSSTCKIFRECVSQLFSSLQHTLSSTHILVNGYKAKIHSSSFCVVPILPRVYLRKDKRLRRAFKVFNIGMPDIKKISEIKLMTTGFCACEMLADRLYWALNSIASTLCPGISCFNFFGIFLVKKIIHFAGLQRAKYPSEMLCLKIALKTVLQSRYTQEKIKPIEPILSSVFLVEQTNATKWTHDEYLHQEVNAAILAAGFHPTNYCIKSVLGLRTLLSIHRFVILLGPSGCGKSQVWKNLKHLNERQGIETSSDVIPVQALSSSGMYGSYDPIKYCWVDGILSGILKYQQYKRVAKQKSPYWVVLDGQINASWTAALEMVFCKGNNLELPNAENIAIHTNTKFISETISIRHASPSILSYAGIHYVRSVKVQWKSQFWVWQNKICYPDIMREKIQNIGEDILADAFVQRITPTGCLSNNKLIAPASYTNMVNSTLLFLEELLKENQCSEWIALNVLFAHAVVWGMGSYVRMQYRNQFDVWLKTVVGRHSPEISSNNTTNQEKQIMTLYPSSGTCFDWVPFSRNMDSIQFISWEEIMKLNGSRFDYTNMERFAALSMQCKSPSVLLSELNLPSTASFKSLYLLDIACKSRYVALVGSLSSGKTKTMHMLLDYLQSKEKNYISVRLPVFFNTPSSRVFLTTRQYLDHTSSNRMEPREKGKLLLFVDDLHLASVDEYGSCRIGSILRHYTQYGRIMNPKTNSMVLIKDLQPFITCKSISRSDYNNVDDIQLCSRVLDNFVVIQNADMEEQDLSGMFRLLLVDHFTSCYNLKGEIRKITDENYENTIVAVVDRLIDASTHLFKSYKLMRGRQSRDFTNVFDLHLYVKAMVPLLRISSSQVTSPVLLVQYWLNICKFVYTDRLDTLEAKDKCNKLILTTVQQHIFALSSNNLYDDAPQYSLQELTSINCSNSNDLIQTWTIIGRNKGVFNKLWTNAAATNSNRRHFDAAKFLKENCLNFKPPYNHFRANAMETPFYVFNSFIEDFCTIYEHINQHSKVVEIVDPGGCGDRLQAHLICKACNFSIYEIGYDFNVDHFDIIKNIALALIRNKDLIICLIILDYDRHNNDFKSWCIEMLNGCFYKSIFGSTLRYLSVIENLNGDSHDNNTHYLQKIMVARLRFIFCRSQADATLTKRSNIDEKLSSFMSTIVLEQWTRQTLIDLCKRCIKRSNFDFKFKYTIDNVIDEFVMKEEAHALRKSLNISREIGYRVKQKYEEQKDSFGINTVELRNIESCIISQTVDAFLDMQEVVRSNPEQLENVMVPPPICVLELLMSVMQAYKEKQSVLKKRLHSVVMVCCKFSLATRSLPILKDEILQATLDYEKEKEQFFAEKKKFESAKNNLRKTQMRIVHCTEKLSKLKNEEINLEQKVKLAWEKAQPIHQEAVLFINKLTKKDLTELKSFKNPHDSVHTVMKVLLLLFNEVTLDLHSSARSLPINFTCESDKMNPLGWHLVQKMMISLSEFLKRLKAFPTDIDNLSVPKENFVSIKRYLSSQEFNEKAVRRRSRAAAGIYNYIVTIKKYHDAFLLYQPLRERLQEIPEECRNNQKLLKKANEQLCRQKDEVREIESNYIAQKLKMEEAKNVLLKMESQIDFAIKLNMHFQGLEAQCYAWLKRFRSHDKKTIYGDAIMAASLVTCARSLSVALRDKYLQRIVMRLKSNNMPHKKQSLGFLNILCLPANESKVFVNGMDDPLNEKSLIQNRNILLHEHNKCLCIIDSRMALLNFIQEIFHTHHKASKEVICLLYRDHDFSKNLIAALTGGSFVILNILGEVEFPDDLLPLIHLNNKIMMNSSNKKVLKRSRDCGESSGISFASVCLFGVKVNVHKNSKFCFVFSKVPKCPTKELYSSLDIVNFSVSPEFEKQYFLDEVYKWYCRDKHKCYTNTRDNICFAIKELEISTTKLVDMLGLANKEWMIDHQLLKSMIEVKENIQSLRKTAKLDLKNLEELKHHRSMYEKIADRIATCFDFVGKLQHGHVASHDKNNFDCIQLNEFASTYVFMNSKEFTPSLESNGTSNDYIIEEKHTQHLVNFTTEKFMREYIYHHVDEDIQFIVFCFALVCHITICESQRIDPSVLSVILFIMKCPSDFVTPSEKDSPLSWLPSGVWNTVLAFSRFLADTNSALSQGDIQSSLLEYSELWKSWYESNALATNDLPLTWRASTPLELVCITKLLRPDRFIQAIKLYLKSSVEFSDIMKSYDIKQKLVNMTLSSDSFHLSQYEEAVGSIFHIAAIIHSNVIRRRYMGRCGWYSYSMEYDFNESYFNITQDILKQYGVSQMSEYLLQTLSYGAVMENAHDINILRAIIRNCFGTNKVLVREDIHKDVRTILEKSNCENDYAEGTYCQTLLARIKNADVGRRCVRYSRQMLEYDVKQKLSINAEFFSTLFEALPSPTDAENCIDCMKSLGPEYEPYALLVEAEVDIFNACIQLCKTTLLQLETSSERGSYTKEDIVEMKTCLMESKTPDAWLSSMPNVSENLSLSQWFIHLKDIKLFHLRWIREISKEHPLASVVPLNLVNRKEFFFCCVKMMYAYRHKKSASSVKLKLFIETSTIEQMQNSETLASYVTGIYIEGAVWNTSSFQLDFNNTQKLQSILPQILVKPVFSNLAQEALSENIYRCPLFATRKRTMRELGHIHLRASKSHQYCQLEGVAAVCERNHFL